MDDNKLAQTSEFDNQKITPHTTGMATEMTRAQAEVVGAIMVAKQFPRNEIAAENKILVACQRLDLAKESQYSYPKGGQMVSGPSIRLAEVMAQNWTNLRFGIKELSQKDGTSVVLAYCKDLENNVEREQIFTVRHERHTRRDVKKLTDPRDIYEMVANMGARRLRSCILAIIPKHVRMNACAQCDNTLGGASDGPIIDRIKKMAQAFQEKFQVPQEAIEKRLGHKLDVTSELELVQMIKVFNSLKDGMASREQFFTLESSIQGDAAELNEKFSSKDPEKKEK